ncbi:MAG: ATP phosphoribosyltransferase regulatory subunit [Thermoplasmatota archaeon]
MKKDVFSESKKLADITKKIRDVLELWNYSELFLPNTVEYDESLRKGIKLTYNNDFYLTNPDVTSQIVQSYSKENDLKCFYISDIQEGLEREIQLGVEYIGSDSLKPKVEILNVLITILEKLDIDDFYIDISSLKVWKEVISGVERYKDEIFKALKRRNLSVIDDLDIKEERKQDLWELLNLRGEKSGFKKIDELLNIIDDERLFADLGTVRPLSYYYDIIFEVYSPNLGYPIGAGGEYFVNEKPSCGFALNLDNISKIYELKEEDGKNVIQDDIKSAYKTARKLVNQGKKIEVKVK